MDSSDILLGCLWMYDKNGTYDIHNNTYMFVHGGKQVTFHPKKLELLKKGLQARATKEAL